MIAMIVISETVAARGTRGLAAGGLVRRARTGCRRPDDCTLRPDAGTSGTLA